MSNLNLQILVQLRDRASTALKAIEGGSGKLAQALKAAKDELSEMEKAEERMIRYRGTEKNLAITANTFAKTKEKIAQLREEIAKSEAPTKAQNRALNEAVREAEQLKVKHQRLQETQQRLFEGLKKSGHSTDDLANKQRSLREKINNSTQAITEQEKALKAHGERMKKLADAKEKYEKASAAGEKISGAGRGMMIKGGAITALAGIPVAAFAKAEDAEAQLKAAMMRQGGGLPQEFAEISQLAQKLGDKLPGTTADLQGMMTALIRQGTSAKTILGGVGEATAYLGVQLRMGYGDAAEFAAKLQKATNTSESEMMGLMDTIQRAYYMGINSDEQLAAFAKMTPLLSLMKKEGVAFANEMAPLVVQAIQSGASGEVAGSNYSKMFLHAIDPKRIEAANKLLANNKIKLNFTDGKGGFGGLENFYKQMEKLKPLTDQKRNAVIASMFGENVEMTNFVTKMITQGIGGYRDIQKRLAQQADIQRRVNAQLGTLKALWEAAGGTFENALVAFGETLAPELKALTEWITETSESLQKWAKENPRTAKTLMRITAIVGVLMIALGGLLVAVGAIIGPLAWARWAITTLGIQSGITGAALNLLRFALLRVLAVAGAFAAGFAFGSWLYDQASKALSALRGYSTTLGGEIWEMVQKIKQVFSDPQYMLEIGVKLIRWMFNGLLQSWAEVFAWFGGLGGQIVLALLPIPPGMAEVGRNIVNGLWQGFSDKWEWLKGKLSELVSQLPDPVKKVLDINSPSRVFARLGEQTIEGLALGMSASAAAPLEALAGIAQRIAGTALPPFAAALSLAAPNAAAAPTAADNAHGGIGPIYITVNAAPGMDEQKLARLIRDEIMTAERDRQTAARSRLTDLD